MSTPLKQVPEEQSEANAEDPSPDQPGSESTEAEEGECGFCLFMKGGGCRDAFIDWEKYCMQEAETNNKDLVEKCAEVTAALTQCMRAHSDYYEPILRAVENRPGIELEKERQASKPNEAQPPNSHSNQDQK